MKLCLLCLISIILFVDVATSSQNNDVLKHLGTRTPYRFKYNKNETKIKFPGCKDKKIWMVFRHGTRLPSPKDIVGMNTTLKELMHKILMNYKYGKVPVTLTKDQIQQFEEWKPKIEVDKEKFLTLEGREEMVLLAERMQKRFPNTIKKKYSNETFYFRFTPTERTQQSARYFANGLFDQKEAKDVIFAPTAAVETTLRFYKHCDRWQEQVKRNPETYKEQKLFGTSLLMNETLESVSKRLGFTDTLSLDQVTLMYKICGYETSWNKYFPSPWCAGFDKESAEILEYYYDLKTYWLDGYGHELTYRQACMLLKNMFDNFGKKGGPKASFLFSHSGSMLKILSHLGLFKPETHLRADNMDLKRKWKATDIDCFASNLGFVLFDCEDGRKILTLHQERIIKMPMCDTELCPYEKFEEYYKESILNCDFSDMCSLETKKKEL